MKTIEPSQWALANKREPKILSSWILVSIWALLAANPTKMSGEDHDPIRQPGQGRPINNNPSPPCWHANLMKVHDELISGEPKQVPLTDLQGKILKYSENDSDKQKVSHLVTYKSDDSCHWVFAFKGTSTGRDLKADLQFIDPSLGIKKRQNRFLAATMSVS